MPLPIFSRLNDEELVCLIGSVALDDSIRTAWQSIRIKEIAVQAIEAEQDRRNPDRAKARKYKNALLDIQRASCAAYAVASGLAEEVKGIVKQALEGD